MSKKKYCLNVVFGERAADYAGDYGFKKARRHLQKASAEGSAGVYAFDTKEDRDTAAELLDASDGWLGVYWEKENNSKPINRPKMFRKMAVETIKEIMADHKVTSIEASTLATEEIVVDEDPCDANNDFVLDSIELKGNKVVLHSHNCSTEQSSSADLVDLEILLSVLDLIENNEANIEDGNEEVSLTKSPKEENDDEPEPEEAEQVLLCIQCDKGHIADSLRDVANAVEESEYEPTHLEDVHYDCDIQYKSF